MKTLLALFLLIYGLGALATSWWAYGVTHSAFSTVRTFANAVEQERREAVAALQQAGALIVGLRIPATVAAETSNVSRQAQGLAQRVQDLIGGVTGQPAQPAQPAQAPLVPELSRLTSDLGELDKQLGQLGQGWNRIGETPFRIGLLDQVELATNVILIWMAAHGLLCIFGSLYLFSQPRAQPSTPLPASRPDDRVTALQRPNR